MLDVEFDYDFQLIGICSQSKDYKMAWELNRALSIGLERDPNNFQIILGKSNSEHPIFRFQCEQSHVEYELIANKGTSGFLIPEKKQVPYFLLVYANILMPVGTIVNSIKNQTDVSLCFEVDIESLMNKENLITA